MDRKACASTCKWRTDALPDIHTGLQSPESLQTGTLGETLLSLNFTNKAKKDVIDNNIHMALKFGAKELNYPELRGIPIERMDIRSLRGGGKNVLVLVGYEDREIEKMGQSLGGTFKEYICDQLSHFLEGMSRRTKKVFVTVNVEGGV